MLGTWNAAALIADGLDCNKVRINIKYFLDPDKIIRLCSWDNSNFIELNSLEVAGQVLANC